MDSGALARYGQILTRAAEGDDIHRRKLCSVQFGYIAVVLHLRQPLVRDKHREWFNFAAPLRLDPCKDAAKRKATGAVK